MSVTDPLLKRLKEYILSLIKDPDKNLMVDDRHSSLIPLCQSIEEILRKGLLPFHTPFGITRKDYWHWIQQVLHTIRLSLSFLQTLKETIESTRVASVQGKGRLFIRSALKAGCLHLPVEAMVRGKNTEGIYSENSIMGDEILGEIFLSLLYQLSHIKFELNVQNSSFLDEMWLLPPVKDLELCPCVDLGIYLGHVSGRAVVLRVDEGSVAAEDNKIEVGDVIDEVYGCCIRGWKKNKINSLLRQNKGIPVPLKLIKGHDDDGIIFPGLISLFRKLNLDIEGLQELFTQNQKPASGIDNQVPCSLQMQGHRVSYLGCVEVGKNGDVSLIEHSVTTVLSKYPEPIPVVMIAGEIGVQSIVTLTRKVLLRHSYTEISSCGRRNDKPLCFAYIAKNSSCDLSYDQFTCYVFQTESEEISREMLLTLADGFHRTHWAV